MPWLFEHQPRTPRSESCQNGYVILCNAHYASSSFLQTFLDVRSARKAKGTPTDTEQDLLRAMLSFASAGLDALVKQLVQDALPLIIDKRPGAGDMFRRSVERLLRTGDGIDQRRLAEVISDHSPRSRLVELLVKELTSNSLQSTDELLRVAAHFDIPSAKITTDPKRLSEVFHARNQIAHEMDVDLSQPNRPDCCKKLRLNL